MAPIARLTKVAVLTTALVTRSSLDGYSEDEVWSALQEIDSGAEVGLFTHALLRDGLIEERDYLADANVTGEFASSVRKTIAAQGKAMTENPSVHFNPAYSSILREVGGLTVTQVMGQIDYDRLKRHEIKT